MPITTIYILGFKLKELDTPCVKVERTYKDLINNKELDTKNDVIEKLTHDSFIVQVERITNRYQTRLDKLLSIFEQSNFIDESKIIKEFKHELDSEEIRTATDILHFVGTNPEEKRKIETEKEAWRTVNAMFEEKEKEFQKTIQQLQLEIDELKRKLNEN